MYVVRVLCCMSNIQKMGHALQMYVHNHIAREEYNSVVVYDFKWRHCVHLTYQRRHHPCQYDLVLGRACSGGGRTALDTCRTDEIT